MKTFAFKTLVLLMLCFSPALIFAQSPWSSGPAYGQADEQPAEEPIAEPPADTADVPFDGGLSLVIAAGVGYAAKKARDKRKQSEIKDQLNK